MTNSHRARLLLLLCIGLLAVLHAGVAAYHFGSIVAFPYDLDYGEGYVLNDAVRLSHRQPVYVDLQQFPMVRSPYPPLFPWLWSLVVPFAGPEFWPGRLASLLASCGLVALVAWHAWRACRGAWPAVAAAALIIGSPFVYDWAAYARVDMLALLFGVASVLAAQWLAGWRGVCVAAALCVLALWTKQTTITAATAVALALTLRAFPRGLAFVALVAVPTLLLGLALNLQTNGEFTRHVLGGNASNPILPARALVYVATCAALHLPALVAGAWWLRRALTRSPSPVAVYLPIALLAAFSAGNGGSSVNYLIEPVIALALAVPFAWRAVPSDARVAAPLLAAVQLAVLAHWPNGFGTGYLAENALGRTPTAFDRAVGASIDAFVLGAGAAVIAEPAGFAVRRGLPVYVQPIDLRAEELLGRWSPAPLVDALASGRFRAVVTTYNLFPAAAERAFAEHFDVVDTVPSPDGLTFTLYRYRR